MEQMYAIGGPNVVRESFGQEVVVVHLETGNYYSLEGTAGEVWSAIEEGSTTSELEQLLASRYAAEQATVREDLREFLQELVSEKLVHPSETAPRVKAVAPSANRLPYSAPKLGKFTDMQDLLLLDPIHDVDESGWPLKANGQA